MNDVPLQMSEFSPSVAKVASIDYLLTKIFEYLPLRSLVRFKSVSNHWLSLITDPQFSPLLKPRNASALFLLPLSSEPFNCEVDFLLLDGKNPHDPPLKTLESVHDSINIKILHSCNGLLLCSNPRANGGDTDYFVHNPTTNQIAVLSRPGNGPGPYGSWRGIRGIYLAYDPLKSLHYNVVCVWRFAGDLLYKILIYSSGSRDWRFSESDEYFYYSSKAHFDRGAYWNGAVHWYCDTDNWLYFDIDQEKLNIMPSPEKFDQNSLERTFVYFGESNGHLHVVEDCEHDSILYVHEMERSYLGWYVKYKVSLDNIGDIMGLRYPIEDGDIKILSIVCGERDEDLILVLQVPGASCKRVVGYGLGCEALEVMIDFDSRKEGCGGRFRDSGWCDAFMYIESLASV